jgi:antitoxin component of MazEF toxin-antitoxin module
MSSKSASSPARLQYRNGSFGALDALVAEGLHLSEGQEVDVREEDGKIVIEPIRPKILEPASDVRARAERQRKIAEATEHAMAKHHDLLALLAK